MLFAAALRQVERVLQQALGAVLAVDRFLDADFAVCALNMMPPSAVYSPSVFSRTT